MVRDDRLRIARKAEGVLEFAAHCQHRRRFGETRRQPQRSRRIATRATQHTRFALHDAGHRIVDPACDIAVVHQENIRNAAETRAGIRVVDARRLVAGIAACHHERRVDRLHQQAMQRRGRQHETQRAHSRRHALGATHSAPSAPMMTIGPAALCNSASSAGLGVQ
jgi:hypothetical protein